MAVKSSSGRVLMFVNNQPTVTPPIVFQDLTSTNNFSFSFWVKVLEGSGSDVVLQYACEGAELRIGHDIDIATPGQPRSWYLQITSGAIIVSTFFFQPVIIGRWTVISLTKSGIDMVVYMTTETLIPDKNNPVSLVQVLSTASLFTGKFKFLHMITNHTMAICNLKYWNTLLFKPNLDIQVSRWDAVTTGIPSAGPPPMWASTLRTPGDISNIANPWTSQDWGLGHAYALILPNEDSFQIELPDPAYLAEKQPCPTWLYAIPADNPKFNPGTTPITTTTYKAPQFWQFRDRGSIPQPPFMNQVDVTYYAFPFAVGLGIPQASSWALVLGDGEVELNPDFGNPANQFEQDTGVAIPGPANAITSITLYQWKFGGQFIWTAQPTPFPTAEANLGYPHLFVIYIGYPTGTPFIDPAILTGIFAMRKDDIAVDQFNAGVRLKIPNPTIRTAYLGE